MAKADALEKTLGANLIAFGPLRSKVKNLNGISSSVADELDRQRYIVDCYDKTLILRTLPLLPDDGSPERKLYDAVRKRMTTRYCSQKAQLAVRWAHENCGIRSVDETLSC